MALNAKLREIGAARRRDKAEAGGRMMDVIIYHNPAMRNVAQRARDDPQFRASSRTSSNISNARRRGCC